MDYLLLPCHAGEISMYEVVALQDSDCAALAGRPWPPVSEAQAAAATAAAAADAAAADGLAGQEQLLVASGMDGGRGSSGALQPDDAAPLLGPQLPPGGSFLADMGVPDAAPAAVPQVAACMA